MDDGEEDPKIVARNARRLPETDRALKQFCKLESSVDAKAYKAGHDQTFNNKCLSCDGFGTVGLSGRPAHVRSEERCRDCDGTGKKVP